MDTYMSYLEHHGILGQKWGVRRFQNEDGSLTSAGKKRRAQSKLTGSGNPDADKEKYQQMSEEVKRMNLEKQYDKLKKEREAPSNIEEIKNTVDQTNNFVREMKNKLPESKPRMDLSNMTDQELREKVNRELLERQYNNLMYEKQQEQVNKGKAKVRQILEASGTILSLGSTALTIALSIQKLMKKGG